MRHFSARLAIVVLLALAVRAAEGQQPMPAVQRGDPYAPQVPVQPRADGQRYPLPPPGYPLMPPQPVMNQALRYPLPTGDQEAPAVGPPPGSGSSEGGFAQGRTAEGSAPTAPQAVLFQPGQIVARVGDKTILYGDVAPTVELILAPVLAKAKSELERQSIEAQREALTKNVIQGAVQNKMLLLEWERGMPSELKKDDKKRKEQEDRIHKQVRNSFEQSLAAAREKVATASQEEIEKLMRQDATIVRLAVLMKDRHLESPGELDMALRQYGTSLAQQVREYGEYMMGIEAARSKIGLGPKANKKEITHQEMLDYYQEHLADYYIPAKARFEILSVKFSSFGGDRAAAERALVEMGNAVFFGAPFAAVAKKHSQEPRASDGGYYDWITPGSLASKPIERAVFSLQVDRLSQIVEDEQGLHIIHVIERKDPGQVSFLEAQQDIKTAIEGQRRSAEQQKYLVELRARTKIWTIFDAPADVAAQPEARGGAMRR